MNSFTKLLNDYANQYRNGCFIYRSGDKIKKVSQGCPDKYGVYVIYGVNNKSEVIYIGAAGTVDKHGNFKKQGIKGRISNTRNNNEAPDKYYRKILETHGYSYLKFKWFITFDNTNKILPKFAEAKLIQYYYKEKRMLSKENKEF